jgi:hypothetical protein
MPPKKASSKKKVVKTADQLEEELKEWKTSEEWQLIEKLNQIWEDLKIGDKLTGTEDDLKFRVHPFLDEFQKIGAVFKIKNTKIKEVTQEHLRVAFFAGYQNRNQTYKIDGKEYMIEDNDINIDSNRVQCDFMKIKRLASDEFPEVVAAELQEKRKKIMDEYKDFVKYFKKFTKKGKGFNKAKDMMMAMLKPLQDLLQCNMGLTMIDFEYPEEKAYDINNFRYKALITTFCKCYMEVQKILYDHPKIDTSGIVKMKINGNPDIYSILKKFQYLGWRKNHVESFYIQPLMDAFMKLKANMTKLYLLGFSKADSPRLLVHSPHREHPAVPRHQRCDLGRGHFRATSGQPAEARAAELHVRPDQHHLRVAWKGEAVREGQEEEEDDQSVHSPAHHPQESRKNARSIHEKVKRKDRS